MGKTERSTLKVDNYIQNACDVIIILQFLVNLIIFKKKSNHLVLLLPVLELEQFEENEFNIEIPIGPMLLNVWTAHLNGLKSGIHKKYLDFKKNKYF